MFAWKPVIRMTTVVVVAATVWLTVDAIAQQDKDDSGSGEWCSDHPFDDQSASLPIDDILVVDTPCSSRIAVKEKEERKKNQEEMTQHYKTVQQVFALGQGPWKTLDPFLFCVYHKDQYPQGEDHMGPNPSLLRGRAMGSDFSYKEGWSMYHGSTVPGFPQHPHRGFETITVTREGFVDHSDSLGATARYGMGDTQWMTAGGGVQHSEMFPLLNRDKANTMELFQIWLNLPKASKFVKPHFSMFWNEETPRTEIPDENGIVTKVRIVAGKLNDVEPLKPPPESWATQAEADVAVWTLGIPEKGSITLPPATSAATNRVVYHVHGEALDIDGTPLKEMQGAKVDASVPMKLTALGSMSDVLILQGRPIGEPVVSHGPFVMNTEEDIRQAFADYRRTEFGGWPWDASDHTHSRDTQRHARYPDGTLSSPPPPPSC